VVAAVIAGLSALAEAESRDLALTDLVAVSLVLASLLVMALPPGAGIRSVGRRAS
jgi:hypothetical protein